MIALIAIACVFVLVVIAVVIFGIWFYKANQIEKK